MTNRERYRPADAPSTSRLFDLLPELRERVYRFVPCDKNIHATEAKPVRKASSAKVRRPKIPFRISVCLAEEEPITRAKQLE